MLFLTDAKGNSFTSFEHKNYIFKININSETTREFELFQLRLQQLEKQKGDDFLKNKLILRQTSAQEELEIQMEATNEIKLRGVKELPPQFKVSQNENIQTSKHEFLNVPLRVTNAYGLLVGFTTVCFKF